MVLTGYLQAQLATPSGPPDKDPPRQIKNPPQIEVLEHRRVQDAELTYPPRLPAQPEVDGSPAAVEEGWLIDCFDEVPAGLGRILRHLEIHTLALEALLVREEGDAEHRQDPIQEAMDDLEAARLATVCRCKVSLIPGLWQCSVSPEAGSWQKSWGLLATYPSFAAVILDDNIRSLRNHDGKTHALVFANGFHKAG